MSGEGEALCTCPACGAVTVPLGRMARLSVAYRCRDCAFVWVMVEDGEGS